MPEWQVWSDPPAHERDLLGKLQCRVLLSPKVHSPKLHHLPRGDVQCGRLGLLLQLLRYVFTYSTPMVSVA
jgi:hypothetical protein